MKVRSTHVRKVNSRRLLSMISLDTRKPYIRVRSTHAGNKQIKCFWVCLCMYQETTMSCLTQHQQAIHKGKKYPCRVISLNTDNWCMKVRSTHARNVNSMRLLSMISLDTRKAYMRERSTHAGYVWMIFQKDPAPFKLWVYHERKLFTTFSMQQTKQYWIFQKEILKII
jgi:mRNA-degrading endonuclease HigB of HigAB toxin-antitoxin module